MHFSPAKLYHHGIGNELISVSLTSGDRKIIEQMLNNDDACIAIAGGLDKDPRTVSREINARRDRVENKRYGLYGKFDDPRCQRPSRYPFVCNACTKRNVCFRKYKYFYDPHVAQENYEIILSGLRMGVDVTLDDKAHFDAVLKAGVENGQLIHHIICTHIDDLRYSERSVYRLVDRGQTLVQPIDLLRKVKLKPRKYYLTKEDSRLVRKGRTYVDFIKCLAEKPTMSIV